MRDESVVERNRNLESKFPGVNFKGDQINQDRGNNDNAAPNIYQFGFGLQSPARGTKAGSLAEVLACWMG